MYSPYLYARGTELLSLRELSTSNVNVSGLLPVLEPVNSNSSDLIRCLNIWNNDVVVILNPYQNDFSGGHNVNQFNADLAGLISSKNNIIVGIVVRSGFSVQSINGLISSFQGKRVALIYDNPALVDQDVQQLGANARVTYHIILDNSLPQHQYVYIPVNKMILINDGFRKLARNADYNGPEFFTNQHQYVGRNFLGYGDYTITGKTLDLRGGQPSAVASHLIFKEMSNNSIWIRHFVSSNTQRGGAVVATMFLDVADQIANFVPNNLRQFGRNIGLDNYYLCSQSRHSPGLAKNKQYQITHHISFMLDILGGVI
ncbi:sce7725 family protein [Serratia marcescens]|uniref:sce7725 family protein n=1 Tax=Serratia marcescens TaxID=615 RepID=UPI003FA69E24